MRGIQFKSQRGAFLIGALVFVVILGVVIFAVGTLVTNQSRSEAQSANERKAFYAAETGIEYALGVLKDSSDWRNGVSKDSVGDGEFSVSVDDTNTVSALGDTVLVTAKGYKGNIQRSIQVYLIQPELGYSVLAGKDIDFSKGKAVVKGNLHANNKVKIGSKYTINGEVTTAPPVIDMPIVDWDFFKNKAIANGQYVDGDIELDPADNPHKGVFYATGKIKMKDNNVVVEGTLVAENNIELKKNNEKISATPSKFPAIITKESLIVDKNNAEINGLIYCKDLVIKKNNMVINGAIVVTNTVKNEKNNTVINFQISHLIKVSGMEFSAKSSGPPITLKWKVAQ
jgi:hypothetical protein